MKNAHIKLTVLFFLLLQINLTSAQIEKGKLTKGEIVESEIAPGEKHQYKISLDSGQFAFFKLMQQGVDLKITTYDSKVEKIEEFDSPNGKNGPELFTITSTVKGDYLIEVDPFDENEPKGNYKLSIQSIKPKANSPNEMVDELFTAWDK